MTWMQRNDRYFVMSDIQDDSRTSPMFICPHILVENPSMRLDGLTNRTHSPRRAFRNAPRITLDVIFSNFVAASVSKIMMSHEQFA